jgi:hypothetical protein
MAIIVIKTKSELSDALVESIKKLVPLEVESLWIDTDGDEVEGDIWQTASDIIDDFVADYEEDD